MSVTKRKFSSFFNIGWLFWFLAALFYAYEFFHRVSPGVLTAELRESLQINDKQLGLIGAMYLYAYAAFQLPAGILTDKFGPKRLLVFASILVTFGSFLFTLSSHIHVIYFSRFLIGAGSAFAFIGCLKIASIWLPMSAFPLVVGLTNLCGSAAAILGGAPFSFLIARLDWRGAMLQISLLGLVITSLLIFVLKDKTDTSKSAIDSPNTLLKGLQLVFNTRQTWLIALYGALLVVPIAALPEMWGPEYFSIAYSLPKMEAAALTHTIFFGTAFGGPVIGLIALRFRDLTMLMFATTTLALILLFSFLYLHYNDLKHLYPTLFFYGMFTANMLLIFSLIKQNYPEWAQGAAIGFVNMIIMFCGGMSQYGIGWLLDYYRNLHGGIYLISDYEKSLSILPFCLVLAAILTFFINAEYKKVKESKL